MLGESSQFGVFGCQFNRKLCVVSSVHISDKVWRTWGIAGEAPTTSKPTRTQMARQSVLPLTSSIQMYFKMPRMVTRTALKRYRPPLPPPHASAVTRLGLPLIRKKMPRTRNQVGGARGCEGLALPAHRIAKPTKRNRVATKKAAIRMGARSMIATRRPTPTALLKRAATTTTSRVYSYHKPPKI